MCSLNILSFSSFLLWMERMALLIKYLLLLDWILMLDSKTWQENVLSKFSLCIRGVYLLHMHTRVMILMKSLKC